MQAPYKKALLSSGGMDSMLLAHEPELAGAVHVFVNVGQQYGFKEYNAAKFVAESCGAPFETMQASDMARFEHKETGIIPFRNAELILCAAQFADTIYLGVIADEVNSDKSEQFCDAMEAVLCISHRRQYWTEGRGFAIETPFREVTKTELVRRYIAAGKPLDMLLKTVSCYDAGDQHCGRCSSCFKRWVALTVATGVDAAALQPWAHHPAEWKTRAEWEAKLEGYASRRRDDVFAALDIAGV